MTERRGAFFFFLARVTTGRLNKVNKRFLLCFRPTGGSVRAAGE